MKTSITKLVPTAWQRCAFLGAIAALLLTATTSWAQEKNSYSKTNLVSDVPGMAKFTDPNLVNPWGLTIGEEFWVSNAGTGTSTLYDSEGTPLPLVVIIPPSASSDEERGEPTGQVFNSGSGFVVSDGTNSGPAIFIFVSEDGGISGWNPDVSVDQAVLAVDHGAENAIYKGAALGSTESGDRLYATNFWSAKVEIYDENFNEIDTATTFVDPTIPAGYSPFGIANINGSIYVTYAKQDPEKVDDVPGPGHGFVSVFDADGNFIKRLISHRPLNSPWGLALAPEGFGKASGSLLVGNFGNGRINSFDLNTGASHGPLRNASGAPIRVDGLWALLFVDTDLYITAGLDDEAHGLFAEIEADEE
jgi:uncharacterized protein (TIGR03118 family)